MTSLNLSESFEQDVELYSNLRNLSYKYHRHEKYEESLDYAFVAGKLAWQNGIIWRDEKMEDILSNVGNDIILSKGLKSTNSQESHNQNILFLASFVADTGGHSEVLKYWIEAVEESSNVNLFLTNTYINNPVKKDSGIVADLDSMVENIYCCDHQESYSYRIQELYQFIDRNRPDRIVLFINPNDVVSYSTLSALPERPTTVFYNHADHTYWIGGDIIDYLVEFREVGAQISKEKREILSSGIIPLTTTIRDSNSILPLESSLESLNIDSDCTISTSVGNFGKVTIEPGPNYFESIIEILRQHPDHHHIFVTSPPEKEKLSKYLPENNEINNRFHIIGPFADLEPIYYMSDFLIETFPMRGGMVRLESMNAGLPLICYSDRNIPFFSELEYLPPQYPFKFSDKEELARITDEFITGKTNLNRWSRIIKQHYNRNYSFERVHNMIKYIIANPEENQREQDISGIGLDDEVYASYVRSNFKPNEHLLIQSLVKNSEFTITDRIRFYLNYSHENNDQTYLKKIGLGFSSIFGRPGYSLAKRTHSYMNNNK